MMFLIDGSVVFPKKPSAWTDAHFDLFSGLCAEARRKTAAEQAGYATGGPRRRLLLA